ncbi:FAD-dependent monooxygenase [Phyllobacterium sp. K27]
MQGDCRMSIAPCRGRILVSGASVAGPVVAFWLTRYGFEVTVVERAPSLRASGYPIDLRGAAMVAAERMGLLPQLLAAHIGTRRMTFVDEAGAVLARVEPDVVTSNVSARAVELPRGELAAMLFDLTREHVDYRFSQSIMALEDGPEHVAVTFQDGLQETFDLVIGADGLHSNTRKLVFGAEAQFTKNAGFCFAGFAMPNTFGLNREGVTWNVPGRMATLYAAGGQDYLHGLLAFAHDGVVRDAGEQRRLVQRTFAGYGWHVPQMIDAMDRAEDFYFDTIQQVRMPSWHKGRVALVGDAAYAPSFLTGQGTSLALAGAYVLASELAHHPDHASALAAYEERLRPFVSANQATVDEGQAMVFPTSIEQLQFRNAAIQGMHSAAEAAPEGQAPHDALDLRDYVAML